MNDKIFKKTLALCCFLIFFGRGYQYLFWDAPFRVLLWDQGLMSPIIEGWLGISWQEYASNHAVSQGILNATKCIGVFFWIVALSSIALVKYSHRILHSILLLGSFLILFHASLEMKDHFYHLAQFLEFATQFGVPLLLVGISANWFSNNQLIGFVKITIAVTFAMHGLYAIGFYPVPGHFVDMTIQCLGLTEDNARLFLKIAGLLDLVVAIAIFIRPLAKYALIYAVIWGLLTAFARVVAGFHFDFMLASMHQSFYQTIYRIPHGLLPLAALYLVQEIAPSLFSKKKNFTSFSMKNN